MFLYYRAGFPTLPANKIVPVVVSDIIKANGRLNTTCNGSFGSAAESIPVPVTVVTTVPTSSTSIIERCFNHDKNNEASLIFEKSALDVNADLIPNSSNTSFKFLSSKSTRKRGNYKSTRYNWLS